MFFLFGVYGILLLGDKMVNKKANIKILRQAILIVFVLILITLDLLALINLTKDSDNYLYLSSTTSLVSLYDEDGSEVLKMPRGTQVLYKKNIGDQYKVVIAKKEYYVNKDNTSFTDDKVVLEKKLFVRTPVTLYLDKGLSYIKKGEEIVITGYDILKKDGVVNKYSVDYKGLKGQVYGKYLVPTKEAALLNYDANGTYKIHAKRTNTLGGGSAANLDFYPFEKKAIAGNDMPKKVYSLYLNANTISRVDEYIKFAKGTKINAFVVDIKDNSMPAYKSLVMKKYSPSNYNRAITSFEKYQAAIKKIKDAGFYVIGRITVFKDSLYINDHPEAAIVESATNKPFKHNGSYWPTAYNRGVWEFNVELAKEAVINMGFNEIQFDYVRFPDRTYSLEKKGVIEMKNTFKEDKASAIQSFAMYAFDELRSVDAYLSVDVFGESVHTYVTGYGQYWGAISNVVDVMSPMPYPDHFGAHEYNIEEIVWTVPYKLLTVWGRYAAARQKEIPTPAVVRTWVQAYDAIREPHIVYDATKVSEQINAVFDQGLTGGYITWNASSSMSRYEMLKDAFVKEY